MILKDITVKIKNKTIIENFNLSLEEKETICLFGNSGCGKTTLVNVISGLTPYNSGEILKPPKKISMVFQEERLLPWITVKQNISIITGEEKAEYYLKSVGLANSINSYPEELSGGMKRRLSIARALSYDYELLIMDEPFTGLDAESKQKIMDIIKRELNNKQCIIITHDIKEAEYLSDKIYYLEGIPLKVIKIRNLN